jgi:hypothetical protein
MDAVKGAGFERRLRKVARRKKDRKKKIGRDLLAKMCHDLKIDPREL